MRRKGQFIRNKQLVEGLIILLITGLLITSCFLPPTPRDEDIKAVIKTFNQSKEDTLDLVFENMEVPMRYPGRAGAVLWTADQKLQRNYIIAYDQDREEFFVLRVETSELGEDGVFRQIYDSDQE